MSMATLCRTPITLLRATVTLDAMGGEVRNYVPMANGLGRVLADQGSEHDQLGRRGSTQRVQIVTPDNLGARVGDLIQAHGNSYQVSATADMADMGQVFAIYAILMEPAS